MKLGFMGAYFCVTEFPSGHNWFAQFPGPVVFLQAPALASRRTIDPPAPVQWKGVEATVGGENDVAIFNWSFLHGGQFTSQAELPLCNAPSLLIT